MEAFCVEDRVAIDVDFWENSYLKRCYHFNGCVETE
jgi:hypothetical protein